MSKKAPENVPAEKLRAIWQQVDINDWLNLFQELRPSHQWLLSGDIIKAQCIYHTDNTPSMVVNLDRRMVHCFGCHRTVYSPIRFVADLGQLGNAAALSKLKNRFGIRLPAAYMQNLQQIEDNQQLKFALLRVMNDELVDAICNPDKEEYDYIRDSGLVPWLVDERKIPVDVAHKWPVGVLMPQERMAARLDQIKRPDLIEKAYRYFVNDKSKYLAAPGAKRVHEGSIVFFYFTSPTTVGRIRIRQPGTKDFYAIEDAYENEFGIFGINTFPELLGKLENRPLICVEGEMDALSHIAHQASKAYNDICMSAIGGGMGAGSDLDPYVNFGFKEGWIGPDNDTDGVGFARKVLSNNTQFRRVFNWSEEDLQKTVKDVDQAYRVYGFDVFYKRLNNVESFARNYDWAIDQSSREIEKIDVGDIQARTETAAEFGAILRDEAERNVYVDKLCSVYGLDKELIRQGMLPDDDDEKSFLQRLVHKLRSDEYFFLTEKQLGGTAIIMAWSRRKKVMRTFTMNSISSVMGTLILDLGLLEWYIQKELGEPAHLQYVFNPKGEPVKINSLRKTQLVNKAFFDAVTVCIDSAMPLERLVELDQGVHYVEKAVDTEKPVVFIINGSHFFKGTFVDDDIKFEKLECPVHGEYFFRLRNKPWSRDLLSLEDIEEAKKMDPGKVFNTVRDILDTGWHFKEHELAISFLAADIMYTPVATAFGRMVLTSIGGESQSGKSTFMQVFGGKAYPDLRLCDATVVQDDFSAASIRQVMSGSSLRLLLDEFEDSNFGSFRPDRKARVVREIQDIFRTIGSGGSDVYRGTSTGDALHFFLYFPATIGGIFSLKETREVNRYVQVRTKFIAGHQNPVEMIRNKYTHTDMRKLRRDITLSLIPRIPEIIRTLQEVKDEFAGNNMLQAGTDDRLKQNIMPAATIMKMTGRDYVDFMVRFSALKMEEMAEQGANQESTDIWNSILNTPVSLNHHDPGLYGTATVAQMLGDPHFTGFLNGTDIGVYFIPEKKWLVVHWHKVTHGVMRNDNNYNRTQHPGRLKGVADEDHRVIPKSKISKKFLQKSVWPRIGMKIAMSEISIIDVGTTIVNKRTRGVEVSDEEKRRRMLDDIPEGKTTRGTSE